MEDVKIRMKKGKEMLLVSYMGKFCGLYFLFSISFKSLTRWEQVGKLLLDWVTPF